MFDFGVVSGRFILQTGGGSIQQSEMKKSKRHSSAGDIDDGGMNRETTGLVEDAVGSEESSHWNSNDQITEGSLENR